ncbi:hypothetical protein AB8A21_39050 [Streptomyces sp. BF23-18]|uniref:hypothetical protein n=1 Tax=Streptomyces sp. BF23-18 TaxID=3240282 RepID=UPI0034E3F7F8
MSPDAGNSTHVFLSETEHHGSSVTDPKGLRARIVQHALFAERLVITDSQVLHNAALRSLLDGRTPSSVEWRADLAELIRSGMLVVVRRESARSLREIRDEHEARNVSSVPTEEYAELMDEITEGHIVPYSVDRASERFKTRTTDRLSELIGPPDDDYARTLRSAVEWIHGQDPLYYNSLRAWIEERRATRRDTSEVALEAVERSANWSFRTALPSVLEIPVAWGAVRTPTTVALQGEASREESTLPGYALNPYVLARLPAGVVNEAVGLESRKVVVDQFARAHSGQPVDTDALRNGVEDFCMHLQEAAVAAFRGLDSDALAAVRDERVRARLHISSSSVATGSIDTLIGLISSGFNPASLMLNLLSVPFDILQDKKERKLKKETDRFKNAWRLEKQLPEHEKLLRIVSPTEPPE